MKHFPAAPPRELPDSADRESMRTTPLAFLALFLFTFTTSAQARHFLYVGDSHSYLATREGGSSPRLGHLLLTAWAQQGHAVDYYAACGSRPATWKSGGNTPCGYTEVVNGKFKSEKSSAFARFARVYDPAAHERVFINLGDNMFNWKREGGKLVSSLEEGRVAAEVKNLLAEFPDATPAKCTWIGPTYHAPGASYRKSNAHVDQMYKAIGKTLEGKCQLIDSRPFVGQTPPSDGLHHGNADSASWGRGILEQVK